METHLISKAVKNTKTFSKSAGLIFPILVLRLAVSNRRNICFLTFIS